jgi:hypothetical protein
MAQAEPLQHEASLGTIVGGTLTLLAFVLAFTFGLPAARYDTRRELLQQEVNAIGTTYLRTGFVPEPQRGELPALLREYVDARVELTAVALVASFTVFLLLIADLDDRRRGSCASISRPSSTSERSWTPHERGDAMLKLDHLRLPVSDLARSRDWYLRMLGLTLEFDVPDRQTVALQDDEGFTNVLQQVLRAPLAHASRLMLLEYW